MECAALSTEHRGEYIGLDVENARALLSDPLDTVRANPEEQTRIDTTRRPIDPSGADIPPYPVPDTIYRVWGATSRFDNTPDRSHIDPADLYA